MVDILSTLRWSRLIWHNFVKVTDNWIKICSLAQIGTCNKHVKFGLKIPNRWGKCQKNSREGIFDSHCTLSHKMGHAHYASILSQMWTNFTNFFTVTFSDAIRGISHHWCKAVAFHEEPGTLMLSLLYLHRLIPFALFLGHLCTLHGRYPPARQPASRSGVFTALKFDLSLKKLKTTDKTNDNIIIYLFDNDVRQFICLLASTFRCT